MNIEKIYIDKLSSENSCYRATIDISENLINAYGKLYYLNDFNLVPDRIIADGRYKGLDCTQNNIAEVVDWKIKSEYLTIKSFKNSNNIDIIEFKLCDFIKTNRKIILVGDDNSETDIAALSLMYITTLDKIDFRKHQSFRCSNAFCMVNHRIDDGWDITIYIDKDIKRSKGDKGND